MTYLELRKMTVSVTLKDLANILGIAPSTVSRALKGHPDISKATQDTVRKLAEQLKYTPDTVALSLRCKKSNQIAVVVPKIMSYTYCEMLEGIMEMAELNGYNILLFDSKEQQEREVSICRSIQKSGVDGVLISITKNTRESVHFETLKAVGVPLVFFDRICGGVDSDKVVADNFKGAYEAVEQMIRSGRKKIANLSAEQHLQTIQKRQMGYIQALVDNQIPVDRSLIIHCDNESDVGIAIKKLMEEHHIDGIFTINDEMAVRALSELKRLGYNVPKDVAVCGFGNEWISGIVEPALSTVEQNSKLVGSIAMELLIKRITAKAPFETETRILKTSFVRRDSTCGLEK